jgi:hypothetical protein
MTSSKLRVVSAVAFGLCLACASAGSRSTGPEPIYTSHEQKSLTYCMGLSDTAMAVATRKIKGVPIAQVKALYAGKPQAAVAVPLVDKVYGDAFLSPWDYTVGFFKECAANVAEVPETRVGLASYCLQRGMIASVAETYKETGAPKETVYQKLSGFKGETAQQVIDTVYAEPKDRAAATLGAWNNCMEPISGD